MKEIERKYLIDLNEGSLPKFLDDIEYRCIEHHVIRQVYISTTESRDIRAREEVIYDHKGIYQYTHYDLYIKDNTDSNHLRLEYSHPIDRNLFRFLMEYKEGNYIEKDRYILPCTNTSHRVESIDFFRNTLYGLLLLEIEYHNEIDMLQEDTNKLLDYNLIDVTDNRLFRNSSLINMTHEKMCREVENIMNKYRNKN